MMLGVTVDQIAEWDAELSALTGSLGFLFNRPEPRVVFAQFSSRSTPCGECCALAESDHDERHECESDHLGWKNRCAHAIDDQPVGRPPLLLRLWRLASAVTTWVRRVGWL
jgi:hypothetical protein